MHFMPHSGLLEFTIAITILVTHFILDRFCKITLIYILHYKSNYIRWIMYLPYYIINDGACSDQYRKKFFLCFYICSINPNERFIIDTVTEQGFHNFLFRQVL